MKLFSKSFLFCLLLKQVVANGCELATRDQQYVRITCKLPKNFTLFDEQEFPRNHFRCSNQAELWVVCGDGQLREIITGGATQLQGRDGFDVFPNHAPTVDTRLRSTFEFLKLILEQNAMFEESVEERNQSSPISVNSTISEVFFTNATTEYFTVTVNGYVFYAIWIGFSILLLTWIILAVIVATTQCKTS